ncbi:MAG: hemerythrin domain-containing protein [Microbacteriaceae bacterium]|nr:hemerythrin domain-containing protein [Microbacteriaceae bacterium]
MVAETLAAALEREHREIDGGIEEYVSTLGAGGSDPEPLKRAMKGLRRHIYLEEEILFPPLRKGGGVMAIFVMLKEHGELWDAMDGLDALLGSSTDAGELKNACQELLSKLDNHNSKEEPIIYPQADSALDEESSTKLRAFLESGEMPEGWRCEKAS